MSMTGDARPDKYAPGHASDEIVRLIDQARWFADLTERFFRDAGVVALAFYPIPFVGGFVEQIGAVTGISSARTIGIVVTLISSRTKCAPSCAALVGATSRPLLSCRRQPFEDGLVVPF
jgi:hypothetical protein